MATYSVLHVVDDTSSSQDDMTAIWAGFTDTWSVTEIDQDTTPPTLPGSYDLVVICETVLSSNSNVSGTYMTADVPLFNMEALSWDEGSEDYVSATGNNISAVMDVITGADAHPIISELGWSDGQTKTLNSASTAQQSAQANFGSGIDLLMEPSGTTCAVWAADTGATLNTGTATNRRAGYGQRAGDYGTVTADGDALIESIMLWLVGAYDLTTHVLAGGITSAVTPTGDLTAWTDHALAGDVSSVVTPAATGMDVTLALAGDVSSVVTPAATGMDVTHVLAGDIASAVAPTGDIDIIAPLAGGVISVTTPTGDLTHLPTGMAGTITSVVTPAATGMDRATTIAGDIVSVVAPTGSMQASGPLVGEIVSAVTPAATGMGTTIQIAGDVVSFTSGDGDISRVAQLSGDVTAAFIGNGSMIPQITLANYWNGGAWVSCWVTVDIGYWKRGQLRMWDGAVWQG